MKKNIVMIAGGTGITPMIQIINEINGNNKNFYNKSYDDKNNSIILDETKVKLLFANHEESDIIMKSKIDLFLKENPNIEVKYILSSPSSPLTWNGYIGRINHEILRNELPPPSSDLLIYVCGPTGMMEAISGNKLPNKEQGLVSGILKDLGYDGKYFFSIILFSYLLTNFLSCV